MTDEELITFLRTSTSASLNKIAADRIEALVKQCEGLAQAAMNNGQALILAEARAERLEAALRSWTETIATIMPEDFRDWHQNSPDEWPLVTVGVIKSLREQLAEYDEVFEMQWNADMRAIEMWQEAHPGNDLVWPDGAKLTVWLMERVDALKGERDRQYDENVNRIHQQALAEKWPKKNVKKV